MSTKIGNIAILKSGNDGKFDETTESTLTNINQDETDHVDGIELKDHSWIEQVVKDKPSLNWFSARLNKSVFDSIRVVKSENQQKVNHHVNTSQNQVRGRGRGVRGSRGSAIVPVESRASVKKDEKQQQYDSDSSNSDMISNSRSSSL